MTCIQRSLTWLFPFIQAFVCQLERIVYYSITCTRNNFMQMHAAASLKLFKLYHERAHQQQNGNMRIAYSSHVTLAIPHSWRAIIC